MDINLGRNSVKLTRKAHRKVRTGCSICKTRKIKCDEQKPQCGRCKKYGSECDIVDTDHAHNSKRILGPGWRSLQLDAAAAANLNMHDLELMFHWDSATHATMSPNPAMQHFFRRNVVSMALRCDFVALSMLALAALHLAHLTPGRRAELTDRSLHYQSLASRKALELLPIPEGPGSEETIENLFIFSSLTMFSVIANSERTNDLLLGHTTPADTPDWLSLFFGTSHLALSSPSINDRTSPMAPIIQYSRNLIELQRHLDSPTRLSHLHAKLDVLNETQSPPELRAIWASAVKELDNIVATLHARPDTRDLTHGIAWLHMNLPDFMPVLRRPSPPQEALVIFCYYTMVLEHLTPQWWLTGWAKRLTRQTYGLLDDEHKTWIVPVEI
ncbi:C6 zinc finger protein [Plectosphaerella plurivora]|uniref:C6 zinc finger protein n=1 Tax=Plectosphaerella plurivora TaxID=936078 RepID=A0A9P9AET8_9PEZI|nr:C6 zinc finger protein [Plectosphaerella plurivora]